MANDNADADGGNELLVMIRSRDRGEKWSLDSRHPALGEAERVALEMARAHPFHEVAIFAAVRRYRASLSIDVETFS